MHAESRSFCKFAIAGFCTFVALLSATSAFCASGRTHVFISDLHFGAGKDANGAWRNTEDFRWDADFKAFLAHLRDMEKTGVDLVLVGDVFELWQSPFMECSSDLRKVGCKMTDCRDDDTNMGCSEQEALARLKHSLGQHSDTLAAIDDFAKHGENAVYIVPGNHDAALLFESLRSELSSRFKSGRVAVSADGRWLSPDRKIVAEHGHQYDDVNKFEQWPAPFAKNEKGTRSITRPWGENMVQRFYNQYEEALPVIDNLTDEASGVMFAIKEAGLKPAAQAAGKFLRFFILENSFSQIGSALGEDSAKWSIEATRKEAAAFFMDVLASDSGIRELVAYSDTGAFIPATLSDEEINVICLAKATLRERGRKDVRACPTGTSDLSGFVKGALFSLDDIQREYLKSVRKQLAGSPMRTYVYGHTHKAHIAKQLNVIDTVSGDFTVTMVNTGAFQRIASKEQLDRIYKEKKDKKADFSIFDLRPEHLPACYTYVRIGAYSADPSPDLHRWMPEQSPDARAAIGGCPSS